MMFCNPIKKQVHTACVYIVMMLFFPFDYSSVTNISQHKFINEKDTAPKDSAPFYFNHFQFWYTFKELILLIKENTYALFAKYVYSYL